MEIDLTEDLLPTIEVSQQCEWAGEYGDEQCHNRTRRGYFCGDHCRSLLHLQVAPSQIPGAGMGLYTLSDRRAWRIVDEYIGTVVSREQWDVLPNAYGVDISRGRILTSYYSTDSFARYACDAAGPSRVEGVENNCLLMSDARYGREYAGPSYRGRGDVIWLVTSRGVMASEELLVDYNGERATDTYWS